MNKKQILYCILLIELIYVAIVAGYSITNPMDSFVDVFLFLNWLSFLVVVACAVCIVTIYICYYLVTSGYDRLE